jgi:hypothetical protein
VACILSSLEGKESIRKGGLEENQTARAKVQPKKRWKSVSEKPQVLQRASILLLKQEALYPEARAFLSSLQAKALMRGGRVLCFQTHMRIAKA